jgi:hypothetical protein
MPAKRARRGKQTQTATTETVEATTTETDNTEETTMSATETTDDLGIEFVDELPKVQRKVESGVWVKRLNPLREQPGRWARVFGPTNAPHAQINNLRSGSAAGVNPDEFEFKGRMLLTEDGEKQGYVFARYIEDEAERQAIREQRAERSERAKASRNA